MVAPSLSFTRNWIDLDRVTNRAVRQAAEPIRTYVGTTGATSQVMAIDLFATDDAACLLAAVPGVRREDLDLSIHQNTVTISGKLRAASSSEEARGATWFCRELWSGEFRRSFTLPFAVDPDQVTAELGDGILKVTLPRAEHAKPRKIAIGANQPQPIAATSED